MRYPSTGFGGGPGVGMGGVIGSNPAEDERKALEAQKRKQQQFQIGNAALSAIPIIGGLLSGVGGLFGKEEAEKVGPQSINAPEKNAVLTDPYFDPYIQARYYRAQAARPRQ